MKGKYLVTGASGFIGSRVLSILQSRNDGPVKAFIRSEPSSRSGDESISYVKGNLLSFEVCLEACRDVKIIYHLAAGREKSFAECYRNSVIATRNLIEAARQCGVSRIVLVSSMSVYDYSSLKRNSLVDETTPVDSRIEMRNDPYSYGKLRQEELARKLCNEKGIELVIMRPGNVYGPGKAQLPGRILVRTFGFALQPGPGNRIPFTFVENCAAAIVLAGIRDNMDAEIFNVIDDIQPKSGAFLKRYKKETGGFFSLPVPFPLWKFFCYLIERRSMATKGQIPMILNRRKCDSYWKSCRYTNGKIRAKLGWSPSIGNEEALARFFAYAAQEKRK